MRPEDKEPFFEYTLYLLTKWYKDVFPDAAENDLSTLKVLKLLFFVSAAKASSDDDHSLVDDVFDNYKAMPYGHVESDVYNYIRNNNGDLEYFKIDNLRTLTKDGANIPSLEASLDGAIKSKIDDSVDYLKKRNNDLIKLSAFDLVELSHLWYSWKKNYQPNEQEEVRSFRIDKADIKIEAKVFNF